MKLQKRDFITLISLIYIAEKNFNELVEDYVNTLNSSNELLQVIEKSKSLETGDKDFKDIRDQVVAINQKSREYLKKLKKIKRGKETLFNWKFINDNELEKINSRIESEELKKWIKVNVDNSQKIIVGDIYYSFLKVLSDEESDMQQKKIIKYDFLKNFEIKLFLSSSLNIKGKEIAYLYTKNENQEEQILICRNSDVMSDMLLNFSEEVDLSLLDNLMENNDLSHLYYLANKEASTVNSRNEDKNKIEELSEKIRKKLESEN